MNELQHHGILGQKWGVRRFQNPDGTYTNAGKERRGQLKSFRINRYANKDGSLTEKGLKKFQTKENYQKFKEEKNKKRIEALKKVGKIVATTALKKAVSLGVVAAGAALVSPMIQKFAKITMNTFTNGHGTAWNSTTNELFRPGQGNIMASIIDTIARLNEYDWP